MSPKHRVHTCQCSLCLAGEDHPDRRHHEQMNLLMAMLNPQQRRVYAAIESNRMGWGGVRYVSLITGIRAPTISRGRAQVAEQHPHAPLALDPRLGGRPSSETNYPGIRAALEQILAEEAAGDPMSEQVWVRNSVEQISLRLKQHGIHICGKTVWRLLRRMGFSMKYSKKRRAGSSRDCPEVEEQFGYIAARKNEFLAAGLPVISIDTKKKELIGNFKKPGRTWCRKSPEVEEYDFPSLAVCRAVPFGVYDVGRNVGYVTVGVSNDTSEFAITAISKWWRKEGCAAYPSGNQVLILADGGGTNGSRSKAWRLNLQKVLCDGLGLAVTVCHYPPGCSKWNPIERRLFSQISLNWFGIPLKTLPIMLGYIRGTTTSTGLRVSAHLDEKTYQRGQNVSKEEMAGLSLRHHTTCPKWNYTLSPRAS
jgi:hypothetical protein